MAMALDFTCEQCGFEITGWDDGNPYYFDTKGKKQYAHHPDPKRDQYVGIDSDMICLDCGETFLSDSENPAMQCPHCQSTNFCDQFDLAGKPCPKCKVGRFDEGQLGGIS